LSLKSMSDLQYLGLMRKTNLVGRLQTSGHRFDHDAPCDAGSLGWMQERNRL